GACAMKYATAMSPERMNATGRVNSPSTISNPPTSSMTPLKPESDKRLTPVVGETGKLKYFDVPCSRNRRPRMMRKILKTRGDHVVKMLSINVILFAPSRWEFLRMTKGLRFDVNFCVFSGFPQAQRGAA